MERWKRWRSALQWGAAGIAALFVGFEFMMGMGCSSSLSWVVVQGDAVARDAACIEAALSETRWIGAAAQGKRMNWPAHVSAERTEDGGVSLEVSVGGGSSSSKLDSAEVAAALAYGLARRCPALRDGGVRVEVSPWLRPIGFVQSPL